MNNYIIDLDDIEYVSININHAVIEGLCYVLTDSAVEALRAGDLELVCSPSKERYVSHGPDQGVTYHGDLFSLEYDPLI